MPSLLLLLLRPAVLFIVTIAILRSPNKEPYHGADGIEGPGPPRRMNTDEDNQSDQTIKEEETSHSALILITVTKIQCRYRCAMECSEL